MTIKDKTSLHPLELVSIYSKDINVSAVTGPSGTADITSMQCSNNIVFSYIGYETVELSYQEIKKLNFILLLEQTALSLGQVVVSANKWEQDKSEVPVKIQSIKSQETEFQNPQTAADMLASSGSVYIQKSQLGGGSPIIRGFATNRLLMVVDGVRMNTAIFRTGNIQNVISLDANSVANTEVIFGPGSVIYGSDAIGGVMNFSTITPKISDGDKLYFNTNLMTRWSSANNERTGSIDLNLSTGFRAPNIDDIGKVFDSEPGSVVVPNPDLKPEYAYNGELSIIKLFDNIARIDVTGYYTYLDNALVRRNFKLNGLDSIMYDGTLSQVQAIQNAAEANIWGIQLGVDIKFPYGFSFSTNFNYQKGEEVDDAGDTVPLRHAAPWFGISHIIYTAERFKADLYGVYNGE